MMNNSTDSGQAKRYLNQSQLYASLVGWKSYNKTWRFTETTIMRLTRIVRMASAADEAEELNPNRASRERFFQASSTTLIGTMLLRIGIKIFTQHIFT